MKYRILKTPEFQNWYAKEADKSKAQIVDRLSRIETDGHFGTFKDLGDGVLELKWLNGRRVYFALVPVSNILILIGGNKNGQSKDISTAKKLYKRYTDET